jgi:hypothetical protein
MEDWTIGWLDEWLVEREMGFWEIDKSFIFFG